MAKSTSQPWSTRREQAQVAKKATLNIYHEAAAKRVEEQRLKEELQKARPIRNRERHKAALKGIPFLRPGQKEKLTVSHTYASLADIAIEAINEQRREAVLCWPNCEPSAAAVTALLAMADCEAAERVKHGQHDSFAAPHGLRALVYPYARTMRYPLRHIYIEKNHLASVHTKHQIRGMEADDHPAFADYHKTIARVSKLPNQSVEEAGYPESCSPCLDELLPSGSFRSGSGQLSLLWKTANKTDLKKISRTYAADIHTQAKFYLFEQRAPDPLPKKDLLATLDVVFLDMTHSGRNRLGQDWATHVRDFVNALENSCEGLPIVALTEDPWTFDQLRFRILQKGSKQSRQPSSSSVILADQPDIILPPQSTTPAYACVEKCEVYGFGGNTQAAVQYIREARRKALKLGDKINADRLTQLSIILRRCMSLPGSQLQLSNYISKEIGAQAAADLMTIYHPAALVREIQDSQEAWTQLERQESTKLCEEITNIWENSTRITPMAGLLRDVLERFLRTSSRTAVIFRKDMIADFAEHTLCNDEKIGGDIGRRLEKRMLLFLDRAGFDDLEGLAQAERNYIKTLIIVAPTRSTLLSLMARAWLPENIIILADNDMLESAAQDAHRIAAFPAFEAIKARMEQFASQVFDSLLRNSNRSLVFDPQVELIDDIDFPINQHIDLVGNTASDQVVVELVFESGQKILARPKTKIVIHDKSQALTTFREVEARHIEPGEHVCVIGDAFLEMARPLLNITVRAAEEIRDYHSLVLEKFNALPGDTVRQRLEYLVSTMNFPEVSVQRASYWVDLQEQQEVPLKDVIAHAPQDYKTFLAFMSVLSVSETMARHYWTWAVIAQRTGRMRAAMAFHDAYRSILVDGYAAESDHPDRARDIRRLKAVAEDFVSVVSLKKEHKGKPC
ncbi:MAG: hypothetical protein J0M34_08320 [Alphaproteobacteria bacterium]|nr:hypothetical protein [Alphaproteobacteria bacterium]